MRPAIGNMPWERRTGDPSSVNIKESVEIVRNQTRKCTANSGHFSKKDLCTAWTTCSWFFLMIRPASPSWVLFFNDSSLLFNATASQMLPKRVVKERFRAADSMATETSAETRIWLVTSRSRPWKSTSTASISAQSGRPTPFGPSWAESGPSSEALGRCLTSWAHAHRRFVTSKSLQLLSPGSTTWISAPKNFGRNTCSKGLAIITTASTVGGGIRGVPVQTHHGKKNPLGTSRHLQTGTRPCNNGGTACWHGFVVPLELSPCLLLDDSEQVLQHSRLILISGTSKSSNAMDSRWQVHRIHLVDLSPNQSEDVSRLATAWSARLHQLIVESHLHCQSVSQRAVSQAHSLPLELFHGFPIPAFVWRNVAVSGDWTGNVWQLGARAVCLHGARAVCLHPSLTSKEGQTWTRQCLADTLFSIGKVHWLEVQEGVLYRDVVGRCHRSGDTDNGPQKRSTLGGKLCSFEPQCCQKPSAAWGLSGFQHFKAPRNTWGFP